MSCRERQPLTADRDHVREAALTRLLETRAEFAECVDGRYAGGARSAARDSDRLEVIASRILGAVDDLEAAFERLDVARDLCAYLGPNGLSVERSVWTRSELAIAMAGAFEELLHPSACAVLAAAVRLEASD